MGAITTADGTSLFYKDWGSGPAARGAASAMGTIAQLKVYPGYPHGMCTVHADVINPDLLAFIRG